MNTFSLSSPWRKGMDGFGMCTMNKTKKGLTISCAKFILCIYRHCMLLPSMITVLNVHHYHCHKGGRQSSVSYSIVTSWKELWKDCTYLSYMHFYSTHSVYRLHWSERAIKSWSMHCNKLMRLNQNFPHNTSSMLISLYQLQPYCVAVQHC